MRQTVARARDVPIRQGIRQGIRVGLVKNAQVMVSSILPRLIINYVADESWVTYFHHAQRIMAVPMMLGLGVSRTLLPALGEIAGQKDLVRFRQLFLRATLVTGSVITLAILCTLPLVRPLVDVLLPADYLEPVVLYSWSLAIGNFAFAFAVSLESLYIVANQVRAWLWLSAIGSVVTIPINVWLIINVPFTGTAWGLTVYQSWVLVHFCYVAWFMRVTSRRKDLWAPS